MKSFQMLETAYEMVNGCVNGLTRRITSIFIFGAGKEGLDAQKEQANGKSKLASH